MNKFFGFLGLLLVLLLVMVPKTSLAATPGAYIALGVSSFKYSGFKPSKVEQQILDTPGVTGSYSKNDSGTSPEVSVGYCFNQYFCGDMSYTEVKMATSTTVTNVNAGSIDINGTVYDLGSHDTSIAFKRELDISATRLSISGEYPLSYGVGILCRIGVYSWKAHIQSKLALDSSGIYLGYDEYDKGENLMASGGLSFRLAKKITGSVEYFQVKDVTMTLIRINIEL